MGSVSTVGLHPVVADLWRQISSLAPSYGFSVVLTSGYRSHEQQAALYQNRANNPYPVAPPYTSQHEYGLAMDIRSTPESGILHNWWVGAGLYHSWGDPIHYQFFSRAVWSSALQQVFGPQGPDPEGQPAEVPIPQVYQDPYQLMGLPQSAYELSQILLAEYGNALGPLP